MGTLVMRGGVVDQLAPLALGAGGGLEVLSSRKPARTVSPRAQICLALRDYASPASAVRAASRIRDTASEADWSERTPSAAAEAFTLEMVPLS